jgi:hypothetical protein
MSKYRFGDRVVVYGRPNPGCGVGPWAGTVVEPSPGPHPGDSISVRAEVNDREYDVHPKQCRKLKPREKPARLEFETKVKNYAGQTLICDTDFSEQLEPFAGMRVRVSVEPV